MRYSSPFPTAYLFEDALSLYPPTKITYCNRLNTEADTRIQLASIKGDIKEIYKNAKQWQWFQNFLF